MVTCEPSGARHEIVNVVAPVIGTVEAPPDSEFWLKLPSGDVSVQLVTPWLFQKTDVRASSGTETGAAQIFACGVIVGAVDAAGADWVGAEAAGVVTSVCCNVGVVAAGVPTWYPPHEQSSSKNEEGMSAEMKLPAHGRDLHSCPTMLCGVCEPNVSAPKNPATSVLFATS